MSMSNLLRLAIHLFWQWWTSSSSDVDTKSRVTIILHRIYINPCLSSTFLLTVFDWIRFLGTQILCNEDYIVYVVCSLIFSWPWRRHKRKWQSTGALHEGLNFCQSLSQPPLLAHHVSRRITAHKLIIYYLNYGIWRWRSWDASANWPEGAEKGSAFSSGPS